MRYLYLDIETIPSLNPAVRAEIDAKHAVDDDIGEIVASRSIKDPDKIAADIAARTERAKADLADRKVKAAAAAEEEYRRLALNGGTCHIVSIAWAVDNDPVQCITLGEGPTEVDWSIPIAKWKRPVHEIIEDLEAELLIKFICTWDQPTTFEAAKARDRLLENPPPPEAAIPIRRHPPIVVSHHAEFDVRTIWQRCVLTSVTAIQQLRWWPVDARPWESNRIQDTQTMWAGPRGNIKFDALCKIFGLDGKPDDIDGSKVYDFFMQGRIDDIGDYNVDDVEQLRFCHQLMTLSIPQVTPALSKGAA